MVHALREAWRVLKPTGTVIDLRPICVDVPLFILTAAGWKSSGLVDCRQGRVHDLAAYRALRIAVQNGLFIRLKQEYFSANYYWNDLKELRMDVEGSWKEDIRISRDVWQHARPLIKTESGQRRILIPLRMKLTMYQKM